MDRRKKGSTFGRWTLVRSLDQRRHVWEARSDEGEQGAIKFLRERGRNFQQRFRDEIRGMRACQDIGGVLPLLDENLPEQPTEDDPIWMVSALAEPLDKKFEALDLPGAVELCLSLANTLSAMKNAHGISHRDIKPANIFWFEDKWCLGDFGLIDFPDKVELTPDHAKLGPLHYIAPEMLNTAGKADGFKADVYSLGKVLWKMASGQRYPIPGHHARDVPQTALSANVTGERVETLDALLDGMTHPDPGRRFDMQQVAKQLATWLAPAPHPTHAADLLPFAKRVEAFTEKRLAESRRHDLIRAKSAAARSRSFEQITPTINLIKDQLEKAKIGNVRIEPAHGVAATFFNRWVERQEDRDDYNGLWCYEYAVSAQIDTGENCCTIRSGINLCIPGSSVELHDIYSMVVAVAGHTVTNERLVGGEHRPFTELIWADQRQFTFGQPDEDVALAQLTSGLVAHLAPAVSALLSAMERAEET